jgi:hypothetical protein
MFVFVFIIPETTVLTFCKVWIQLRGKLVFAKGYGEHMRSFVSSITGV